MTSVTRKAKDFKEAQNTIGITVSNRQLCAWYDKYAKLVLTKLNNLSSQGRGEFLINSTLPPRDEYLKLKRTIYTFDWEGHLSDIQSWIEDVKDQMENWRDSMPETFHSTDKYSEIGQCCENLESALESLQSVSFDDHPSTGSFAYYPFVGDVTKNTTLGDAIGCLEELISSVEGYENEDLDDEDSETEEFDSTEIVQYLNEALDYLQEVQIPAVFS